VVYSVRRSKCILTFASTTEGLLHHTLPRFSSAARRLWLLTSF